MNDDELKARLDADAQVLDADAKLVEGALKRAEFGREVAAFAAKIAGMLEAAGVAGATAEGGPLAGAGAKLVGDLVVSELQALGTK
jgi:hypothetical protein